VQPSSRGGSAVRVYVHFGRCDAADFSPPPYFPSQGPRNAFPQRGESFVPSPLTRWLIFFGLELSFPSNRKVLVSTVPGVDLVDVPQDEGLFFVGGLRSLDRRTTNCFLRTHFSSVFFRVCSAVFGASIPRLRALSVLFPA